MVALLLAAALAAGPAGASQELVVKQSSRDFATTVRQLEAAVAARKLTLFGIVDHAAGATKAGLSLRPSKVLMLGNPQLGTPLMQAAPSAALDLPQRIAVYETDAGTVHVAYRRPASIVALHGATGQETFVTRASAALDALAAEAVR
jgi:uncharacterized protein (DUF302 family)